MEDTVNGTRSRSSKPEICKGCPLNGEGYASGEGPETATICIVGEALGASEALEGRPFVGGAGRTLNFLLGRAGLRRVGVYVDNAVRCRPEGNRTPSPLETTECARRHDFFNFIKKFNIVVPMGRVSTELLTGRTEISKVRGSVIYRNGVKFLPTLHPAFLMRQRELTPAVISDLEKAAFESHTKEYTAPVHHFQLMANSTHVDRLAKAKVISIDIETRGVKPSRGSISMIGITDEAEHAYVFKPTSTYSNEFAPGLKELLADPAILKVGHNIIFDATHLGANGYELAMPWFDTMIAHHLVLSDVPNDLGFVASLYTRLPYWKDMAKTEVYNAIDTDAAFRIYGVLSKKIKELGMERINETSVRAVRVLKKMSMYGVKRDHTAANRWFVALSRRIDELEKKLIADIGLPDFNFRSNKAVADYLYERLKLPKMFDQKTKKVTVDEEALKRLEDLTGSKVISTLLTTRKYHKLMSTYFSPSLENLTPDGRVHTDFLIHGTVTGRISSKNPNLQNVPTGPAREIYIPDEGNIFIEADYNQIELRLAAIDFDETSLLEAFKRGEDIHRLEAAEIFGVRMSEVTERQRTQTKHILYGLIYGRGARALAVELRIPVAEAQRSIDRFFSRHPMFYARREAIPEFAKEHGYVVTPFGRRRWFLGQVERNEAINFKPQGTALDVILESLVLLDEALPADVKLLLTVHDQVLLECPEGKVERVSADIKEIMERPIDVIGNHRIPIKIKTGPNWGAVK